ncbi:MAG: ABC transporter permease subunit [Anaerolineaceae bacterium]|nr:ABC transporter permease subunit [Anaerolineaceae bacterium]
MLRFLVKRLISLAVTLFAVSVVAFAIIQLPPGDFLTSYIANLAGDGQATSQAIIDKLRENYGLDQSVFVQYGKWMNNILSKGDFGQSFEWNRPVGEVVASRMGMTIALALVTLMITWMIALPIGIYSAVKQYSLGDYVATIIGFIGVAIPDFLISLVLLYIAFKYFNQSVGGLFSQEFENADWSYAKLLDLLSHLWIPVIIIGLSGTASLIRVMRANLLDELRKPYVITARARGLPEWKVIVKYPVRVALNPFISTVGWVLPGLVSGSIIVAVVLSLPTAGPLLLKSLLTQDMYLAGAFILLLSVLTMIGTLTSDILLALVDPRIRYSR